MFQLESLAMLPIAFNTARVSTGSQNPSAADSVTVISVDLSRCARGQTRTWPRDSGAMSRKAMTTGVERTMYAEPLEEWMIAGLGEGGAPEAIMQNGQGISASKREEELDAKRT